MPYFRFLGGRPHRPVVVAQYCPWGWCVQTVAKINRSREKGCVNSLNSGGGDAVHQSLAHTFKD
jgi:hypothetical protein